MLDDLIKIKKITKEQAELYTLFEGSDLGKKWLSQMMMTTFMEQPPPDHISGEKIAFLDGRRSMLREIYCEIEIVKQHIREQLYESRSE